MMDRGGNERLRTSRTSWQIHALVILAYTLLAVALTWPLVTHLSTYVPGNGADDPPLTWNLWWVGHALLDEGTNPFDCNYLFYPLGINLAFYTLTLLNGLLSIPLQAILGLVPASNLLLLSSFVLSGYGAFLLARHLLAAGSRQQTAGTRPSSGILHLAAFVAGLLYAFASNKMSYAALGQWNIASSQWIPFFVLYLFKTGEQPRRWRYPLLAALFLLLQAYAEMTYAAFLILFTALWLLWQLTLLARSRVAGRPKPGPDLPDGPGQGVMPRIGADLVIMAFVCAVGLAPILAMMLPDLRAEGDIFAQGGGFADVFSADLLGYLVPTMHHPLLGPLVDRFQFDHTVGQHIYLGYSVLILALLGAVVWWRRADVRFWFLSGLVFWLLTLGPTLRINGHDTGILLPFALVEQLPFFKANRYPSRYSVLLVLSLAVLVAFGTHWLLTKVATSKAQAAHRSMSLATCCVFVVAVLLFEHLSTPLPLSDMRVPPVYQAVAAQMPDDSTLLDLPVAWRNGSRVTGTEDPIIMFEQYYQSVHHKPILAGNTSRNPPLKFQYFTEAPVINTVLALETGHTVEPGVVERDQRLSADVLRFFNIQAIVVHTTQAGPGMVPYVEETMPVQRVYEGEGTIGYRVDLPPWPREWAVEPGSTLAQLSFAEGWGIAANGVIWAQRQDDQLLVPLDGQAQQMAFRSYAPQGGQRLAVEVNGQTIQQLDMAAGWMGYKITLPAGALHEGLNEVWLRFDALYPASEVRLSPGTIGQTGVESPANLVVQSAGQEVGDFGHIYVDGQDVSPDGRGYNVVVIDPLSGAVERIATFDTHLDEGASQALAAFLGRVPAGRIVAVAAADEASRLLGPEAVKALNGIGATGDLRDKFRWGHAIIGVQGAVPGTALEAMDWMRPVTVVAGEGATEPHLAAAVATLTFMAIPGP
jgi:hypothetical protein